MCVAVGRYELPASGLEECGLCQCQLNVPSRYSLLILTQAGQCVDTINVHRAASANALSAASSECKSWIRLVLDPDQCIQVHRTSLVKVECVALHLWLAGWLVWVPSVNVEGLHQWLFVWRRLLLGRCA